MLCKLNGRTWLVANSPAHGRGSWSYGARCHTLETPEMGRFTCGKWPRTHRDVSVRGRLEPPERPNQRSWGVGEGMYRRTCNL